MILLKLFLGLFIAWLLGYVIIRWFDPERKIPPVEGFALSYLVGQGLLTLLLFLLFLLPLTNRSVIAAAVILGVFVVKMIIDRKRFQIRLPEFINKFVKIFRKKKLKLYALIIIILFAGIFFKISYSFIETCSKPEYAWDACGNWTLAGKIYFETERDQPDKVFQAISGTNSYPKMIPLMHYWLFSWMGEANDQWSKIIFPIELLCLVLVFYFALRPVGGKLWAAVFTYILLSTPLFLYHSTIGYADFTLTAYFAAGIICFYRWIQNKQSGYFWSFALLMAITTWVKLEGKTLFALGFALLLIYLWREHKEPLKNKIFYLARYITVFLVIGLPWQLFIMLNNIASRQVIDPNLGRFIELHQKMYSLVFMGGSWGIIWLVFPAEVLFFYKRQFAGANLYLFMAILMFYGNLLFIYLFFYDSVGVLEPTFNRVLLSIYPVVIFDLACVTPKIAGLENV